MTIGDKLKKARQLNHWTQAEFASIVDLPVSRIQQYEIGYRTPKKEQLEKFSNVLGVSIEYFTDFSLNTYYNIMFALFELEDTFNLQINDINGKHMFSFDDKQLTEFISAWAREKENSRLSLETLDTYNEWKIRFPDKLNK